jgi:hypothetical protein
MHAQAQAAVLAMLTCLVRPALSLTIDTPFQAAPRTTPLIKPSARPFHSLPVLIASKPATSRAERSGVQVSTGVGCKCSNTTRYAGDRNDVRCYEDVYHQYFDGTRTLPGWSARKDLGVVEVR